MENENKVYVDQFDNWDNVVSQFEIKDDEEKIVPDAVYHAGYTYEDYEGTAYVAYRRGDKYFTVSGGHCSCYGLEDQWEPEGYDKETFLAMLDRQIEENQDETAKLIKERVLAE